MTTKSPSLEERFKLQREASAHVKTTIQKDLGLSLVTKSSDAAANGMTAVYCPEGLQPSDIVPKMLKRGVVVAAGLHSEIKTRYFRIGHMGVTVVDKSRGDIETILKALKESLEECGYKKSA